MHDVGESWLMTSLTTSPVLVALVETFGSLPVVLFALPAGALAVEHPPCSLQSTVGRPSLA